MIYHAFSPRAHVHNMYPVPTVVRGTQEDHSFQAPLQTGYQYPQVLNRVYENKFKIMEHIVRYDMIYIYTYMYIYIFIYIYIYIYIYI